MIQTATLLRQSYSGFYEIVQGGFWRSNAYDKSVDTEGQIEGTEEDIGPGPRQLPSEAGGVCKGLYNNPQKTEFSPAKGGQGSPYQRV